MLTKNPVKEYRAAITRRIVEELVGASVRFAASLPDTWIADLIRSLDADERFTHVPVNREEATVALCAGAYMGGMGAVALMGTSGFMTLIYAITKINFTYEIPVFFLVTQRGGFGDGAPHHVSNGLYFLKVLEAINLPYVIIDKPDDLKLISKVYKQSRIFMRPTVAILTKDLLRGEDAGGHE